MNAGLGVVFGGYPGWTRLLVVPRVDKLRAGDGFWDYPRWMGTLGVRRVDEQGVKCWIQLLGLPRMDAAFGGTQNG